MGVGTVVGAAGGVWSGDAMIGLYLDYFKFPTLEYRLSWSLVGIGGGVSLLAALLGAGTAVRGAVALPPAEAMRPEPPARFRPGPFERWGVGAVLSTGGRLILRNLERRPVRAFLSTLGIAFSVAILVIGQFMFDGIHLMMELQFQIAQREDLTVAFNRDVGPAVRNDLQRIEGVVDVELFHALPIRIRSGHRERELALTALEPNGKLRRIVSVDRSIHPVPEQGVVMSVLLAERLDVRRGDTVQIEALTGLRRTERLPVADIVDDLLGISAYASQATARRITGEGPRASGAFLATDPTAIEIVNAELKGAPAVASVASPNRMLESFQQQLDDSLLIAVGFIVGFASVISVAVIYNGTRIALSERGRELASLRVLGFSRREVATLLFGEQAVMTVAAIPMGWGIGYALAFLLVTAMESETYRIPLVVSMDTYLGTALVTLLAAAGSSLLVRRRLNRMDLIAVLKTRE